MITPSVTANLITSGQKCSLIKGVTVGKLEHKSRNAKKKKQSLNSSVSIQPLVERPYALPGTSVFC